MAGLVGVDEVGDAVRQDAGLAGAGAGEHEQRPARVRHRLPLGRVEALEERREAVVEGVGGHHFQDRPRGGRDHGRARR